MRTKLTPAFCQKARAQEGAERTIYWDAELPGFGLVATKGGHCSFVVQYRAGGRSRRMTIDSVLGLVKARKRAKILLGQVANDKDPLQERRKARSFATDTFKAIADAYFAREGNKLRSANDRRAALHRLVFYPGSDKASREAGTARLSSIGSQPISAIDRGDIVKLLDRIEDQNGPVMADRTLAYISKIMNWHAKRSANFNSPIVRGMARTKWKERARSRILTDEELRAIWKAAGAMPGPFGAFMQFLLLTAARRSEAAEMKREELEGSDWILPKDRNKVKVEFVRPLSPAAQALLKELPRIGKAGYAFTTIGRSGLGGFSKFKRRLDQSSGVTNWTLHDLRRTARSLMSRAGISSDHAERCLGHVIGGVRAVYDRHEFHAEKKQSFEALAALIDRIVNPGHNVVQLHDARIPAGRCDNRRQAD
jgi:integrase